MELGAYRLKHPRFLIWLGLCDVECQRRTDKGLDDFQQQCWEHWWRFGATPEEAVQRMLMNEAEDLNARS